MKTEKYVVVVRNEYGRSVYAYEEKNAKLLPGLGDNTNNIGLKCLTKEEIENALTYYNSDDDLPYPEAGKGTVI